MDGCSAGMAVRRLARSMVMVEQRDARTVSAAAWAAWRESSRSWASPARAVMGSSANLEGVEVAAMVRNLFQEVGVVVDEVVAMVGRAGGGDDRGVEVAADMAADVALTGLQLLKMEWKVGACGERVVALAWAESPPFARRSILEGWAGYCSRMDPFFSRAQMVVNRTASNRSASEVVSSKVESAARKVSNLLSRWVRVLLLMAFSIMSLAS